MIGVVVCNERKMCFLANERLDFAFEITLARRTFAPWIQGIKQTGYIFHLVFLWLPNEEFTIARVAERLRIGRHNGPEETIRRRYTKGMRNFFSLYKPQADTWRLYNNSYPSGPELIATGEKTEEKVYNADLWNTIRERL
ncbi:MAG: hypothetical protein FJ266_11095 [Planctomycetes bacterium]|nr:hypothetical protein [Planctomycetota bacterium]